jgi:hypothetical protein
MAKCEICRDETLLTAAVRRALADLSDKVEAFAHRDDNCHTAVGMALMFLAADHLTVGLDPREIDYHAAGLERVERAAHAAFNRLYQARLHRSGGARG